MAVIVRIVSADGKQVITRTLPSVPEKLTVPAGATVEVVDAVTGQKVPVSAMGERDARRDTADEQDDELLVRQEAEIEIEQAGSWTVAEAMLGELAGESMADFANGESIDFAFAAASAADNGTSEYSYSNYGDGGLLSGGSLVYAVIGVAVLVGAVAIASSGSDNDEGSGSGPDTTPPAAPTGLDLAADDDSGLADDDNITSDTSGLTITGTAEADSTVELFDGGTSLGTTTAGGDGSFSIDVDLAEGEHTITATATDGAGNESAASGGLEIEIDTTAPFTPTDLELEAEDDDGSFDDDRITTQSTSLTINGDVFPLPNDILPTSDFITAIEVFNNGQSIGFTASDGDGNFTLDADLPAGTNSLTFVSTDLAGNVSPTSEPLVIEIVSPIQLLNSSVDGNGDVVTLYFDGQLDSLNETSGDLFTVNQGGDVTVNKVVVAGNRVSLLLDSELSAIEPVAVSYTGGGIGSLGGAAIGDFSNVVVTNRLDIVGNNAVQADRVSGIDLDGAEIAAFDPETDRIFVTGSNGVQVVQLDADMNLTLIGTVAVGTNNITSVAVSNGILAVAVVADPSTDPGSVFFLDASGQIGPGAILGSVTVGSLPDMVTFSPDGNTVLVANEGESTEDSEAMQVNPVGSVSVIDISGGVGSATVQTAGFDAFNSQVEALRAEGVRLFAGLDGFESLTVAQDLEPEYIAVSPDGATAFVTLQEANAVAILDIATATITDIRPLGLKSFEGLPADFTDEDEAIGLDAGVPASNASMLDAQNGFFTQEIFTVGETIGGYTPPGVMDGIGAYELDSGTVRLLVNHELGQGDGYTYQLENGTELTGSRVSYFDIDKETMQVVGSGLAFDTIYDAEGNVVTDTSFLSLPSFTGLSRFCSSVLFEGNTFGGGSGIVDTIYFTGEEDGGGFNAVGGAEWALDVETGELWALPAFGRGAWENVTQLDTGTTTHVAFILSDDTSPFDADGDGVDEAAPLYLYIGEKSTAGDANFVERNGLADGDLFVWVPDDSANIDPEAFTGNGATQSGTWVAVDNTPDMAMASDDGSTGYDQFGYPTQRNLWEQAESVGAFQFSRPEDVATNPNDGSEFVLASTGRQNDFNGADLVGEVYTMKVAFEILATPGAPGGNQFSVAATGDLVVLYDGDSDPNQTLRSPDNLDWADDGMIYVQEDRAVGGIFGEGAINPNEAGIVQIDPTAAGGSPLRIANVNRSAVLPEGAVDEAPDDVGNWESSGILDVSSLFGKPAGSLFVADVQAHGIDDQERFVTGGQAARIIDEDLKEGGQLLFLFTEEATTDTFPLFDKANVFGQFQPDAIDSFTGSDGETYYVIANEGDDREDFIDPDPNGRGDDLTLDPNAFPNAELIQGDFYLGRLNVTIQPGLNGDTDGDGDTDRILAYGGRSFSVLNSDGEIVFDSGSHIEQFVATGGLYDEDTNTGLFDDGRSDNKGPEPEGVVTGIYGDSVLAFIALERGGGGVMVYDVTDPSDVVFVQYLRNVDDISPEGLTYISPADSPSGEAVLLVANEVSETLTAFELTNTFTLQLLHLADGEAGLLASQTAPNLAALVDAFEDEFVNSITLAGGDNFIPGPFLAAGADPSIDAVLPDGDVQGRVDIEIHNALGVQASTIGNHEFDLGSRGLRDVIGSDGAYAGTLFPYLSANLDFSGDGDLNRFFEETIGDDDLENAANLANSIVPSAVIMENGQLIGLVGATTQILASISSPSGTVVDGSPGDDDMALLAQQLQPYIDDLIAQGVNKIILMSHLQQIENEIALAPLLEGVDIILSAGSNTRLGDSDDTAVAFPGHPAVFEGDYPIVTSGADGKPTLIVNTDNEYTYVGRLVVEFDENGEIIADLLDDYASINGAYASTAENVAAAWNTTVENLADTAFAEGTRGGRVMELTDAVQDVIDIKSSNVFGYSDVYLEGARALVRSQETNLGDLTADANAAAARDALGLSDDVPVVSIKNGGGIRAQIGTVSGTGDDVVFGPNPNSEVSQLDVENSLRFNNGLITFQATPLELLNLLNTPNATSPGSGGFLQVSGLQVSYDPSADAGDRVVDVALVDANGAKTALVDDGAVVANAPAEINVVILDFTARQDGDGYQVAENGTNFRYILPDGTLSDPLPIIDNPDVEDPSDVLVDANSFADTNDVYREQAAFEDFLGEFFGTPETAFDQEETPQSQDERIQNIEERADTVLTGAVPPSAALSIIEVTEFSLAITDFG